MLLSIPFQSQPYLEFAQNTWPFLPGLIAGFYGMLVVYGPRVMKHRPPFRLDKLLACWNLCLTLFSLGGMIRMVPYLLSMLVMMPFRETLCLPPSHAMYRDGVCGFWKMLFVYSKVVELGDTVFIVLRKSKLSFLHCYHHMTVLLLSWHAYVHSSSYGIYFMSMNYSVHTLMYAYYFLHALGKWPRWFPVQWITLAQLLQMVMGIFLCVLSGLYWWDDKPCSIQLSNLVPAGIIYTTYLFLFLDFFVKRFLLKSRS